MVPVSDLETLIVSRLDQIGDHCDTITRPAITALHGVLGVARGLDKMAAPGNGLKAAAQSIRETIAYELKIGVTS